ncbi:MAG TPA: hypothetical protein VFB30_00115, partial [Spirochaetia bacterium]|nr:hypothetical protein [Spirochaetia bacterium]
MGDATGDFLPRLEAALAGRGRWLETTRLIPLRDAFRTYRNLFETITGTLVKKGLLREDPYEYDGNAKGALTPPDTAIPEATQADELSIRVSAYRRQLELVVLGFPASLAASDLTGVRRMAAIISYIDWDGYGEASRSYTTRALARLTSQVRISTDALSARVISESHSQVEKLMPQLRTQVAELESWYREAWKADVRAKVLAQKAPAGPTARGDSEAELLSLERAFDQLVPEGTWHPELAQEILSEESAEDAPARKDKLLMVLAIPKAPAAAAAVPLDRRPELLEAIRGLCKLSEELGRAEAVLLANERALEKFSLTFFQRIRRWFRKSVGTIEHRYYEIEVKRNPTSEPRAESIDFLKFAAEMRDVAGML